MKVYNVAVNIIVTYSHVLNTGGTEQKRQTSEEIVLTSHTKYLFIQPCN